MNKRISMLILVVPFAVSGTSYAQTQAPPDPGASATPGTTNPSKSDPSTATPGVVSPSPARTDPDHSKIPATRMAEAATKDRLSAGTVVLSPTGQQIGTIKDFVPDPGSGKPNYVVVAMRSGAKTAVPYSTIAPLFIDGRVTLDRSRLEEAPHVSDSQLRDDSDQTWQQKAQQYWNASR